MEVIDSHRIKKDEHKLVKHKKYLTSIGEMNKNYSSSRVSGSLIVCFYTVVDVDFSRQWKTLDFLLLPVGLM